MDVVAIGKLLRNARMDKQMRQSDVAARVGMTASNYARYAIARYTATDHYILWFTAAYCE